MLGRGFKGVSDVINANVEPDFLADVVAAVFGQDQTAAA